MDAYKTSNLISWYHNLYTMKANGDIHVYKYNHNVLYKPRSVNKLVYLQLHSHTPSLKPSHLLCSILMCLNKGPGYRFTKGLTQNLNLCTNLKLEYNIKSLTYIQKNFRFQAWFLTLLNYVFYLFDMISGLKVIEKGNYCATLHFV